LLPLAAADGRTLFSLDAQVSFPVVQIALLRSIPLFTAAPAPTVQGLAAAGTPAEMPAGTVLIRQGEPGMPTVPSPDSSTSSRMGVSCGVWAWRGSWGDRVCCAPSLARRRSPPTPTPQHTGLPGELFLTAVLGHAATQRQADSIADAWLAADARRGGDTPVTGTVGPG
jgi:hypothetical protein